MPDAPSGWTGPLELYDGTSAPPPCGSAYDSAPAYTGYAGLSAHPAICSCACGAASGLSCDFTLTTYTGASCSANPCATTTVTNSCSMVDLSGCTPTGVGPYWSMPDPAPTGGTCAPGAVGKSVPAVSWSDTAQACVPATAPTPAGCSAGDVCAPLPDPGYNVCVTESLDVPCPSGSAYSVKRVAYGGDVDTRDCGACTCGAVTGASCTAWLYLVEPSCAGGASANHPVPLSCVNMGAVFSSSTGAFVQGGPSGGSCAGSSSPTGGASPTGPMTFCCLR